MTVCLAHVPTNVEAVAYSGGVVGPKASIERAAQTPLHSHSARCTDTRTDGGIVAGDASDAGDTFQRAMGRCRDGR